MYKFINFLNKNPHVYVKHLYYFNRFYRTKHRKKVSVELNRPSLYDNNRNAPSKLLKANLFTPESAGPKELSMLCYWIVHYGYADYSILTRYIQCTIDNIKKLRIKGIALVLHSVSKYLYNNRISLLQSDNADNENLELTNRNELITKCVNLILRSHSILPNLFVNAVPKDLGMIALSITNIYQMFMNECDVNDLYVLDANQISDENGSEISKNNHSKAKSVNYQINKLMQKLSAEIIPKLPFCELDEFAAFSKSFSTINSEWSNHFMRELSLEVSSLLMEKIEDLEILSQNKFIGEDLIEQLNKLPRDLSTLTCSLSKLKINEPKFWERSQKVINLLLKLKDRDFGIKNIDLTTLTLLCTSMYNYVDVSDIVNEMLVSSTTSDQPPVLIGFNTSLSNLKDELLASKFLDKVNVDSFVHLNPTLVSQFILNFSKSGFNEKSEIRDGIVSLLSQNLDCEVLSSIFISGHALNLSAETRSDLCERLSINLSNLKTKLLVTIFINNLNYLHESNIRNMSKKVVDVLNDRVEEIPLRLLPLILTDLVNNFGGNMEIIKKICNKIDENLDSFNISEVAAAFNNVDSMGMNVNKLFNKNNARIRDYNELNKQIDEPYAFDPENHVYGNDSDSILDDSEPDYTEMFARSKHDNPIYFTPSNEDEVSKIAKHTLEKSEPVTFFKQEDFEDFKRDEIKTEFELKRYPSNQIPEDIFSGELERGSRVGIKGIAGCSNIEELKKEWSELRKSV